MTQSTSERPATSSPGFAHAYRALRHRNFRLFFAGQSISLIGTWMTRIATAWLVYRLTHSAILLGTVSFAGQIPTFLLAPLAGVLVDRWDRRRVLVWTQALAMAQSLIMAVLTLGGWINISEILALSVMQGMINAFDMPGRQSFLHEMVTGEGGTGREDLSNAIAINSSMVNVARLIGPSLAGILIAATSEGWCFLVDGVSYIAVIVSLVRMRLSATQTAAMHTAEHRPSMLEQLKEGWDFVRGFAPIRTILLLFALVSLMGMPFVTLMPVFAAQVLKGGPHTLGFLMAAMGVGSLASALALVLRKSVRGLLKMIPIAAGSFGIGLILFGLSSNLWTSMAVLLLCGFGMMQGLTASNTIIQTIVPEDKRGRVMSYYTIAFVGMAPFGSLMAGTLAAAIGAPWTVMISGVFCIGGAGWFLTQMQRVRREMRPVYERLGIVPVKS
ncbi:MAG TPA: MFS transporter [Acidobacteriaceae bacterium]|nr:MFS transporter [Acidobacteriaceae bacterium]